MLKGMAIIGLMIIVNTAQAGVYKCRNAEGRLQYQSMPCEGRESEKVRIDRAPSDPGNVEVRQNQAERGFAERRRQREAEQERLNAKSKAIIGERDRQRRFDDLVRQDRIAIGMTEDQAIKAWGRPCDINRSLNSSGTREQWVYCVGEYERKYLYFDNGILSGMN
ncbi:DUF4124 domain-containing protein [Marinobacterium mangrovicola]|uniref:Uncharacterized protein DUF4124 n=1 Tax=Marinobacterium mangrovicola TaxID=1476959 RepID=A0A4R1GDF5_9GAMM|nr:DUF4124 domain-containing protein [Marinobacterium mangrovicola]TCK05878.1 uncharacterized protein DUF4124 [Marinobacterium mangrovicola]